MRRTSLKLNRRPRQVFRSIEQGAKLVRTSGTASGLISAACPSHYATSGSQSQERSISTLTSIGHMSRRAEMKTLFTVTAVAAAAVASVAIALLRPPKPYRNRLLGPQKDELQAQMDFDMYEGNEGFWDDAEDAPLRLVNHARVPYFSSIWSKHIKSQAATNESRRYLDVGCGGGVATEELAKLGFHITGLDPAAGAIGHAVQRAETLKLNNLEYQQG